VPKEASAGQASARLVLLGRRSDLLQLHGQADLPPRFLGVFEGTLEQTAGDHDTGDLDRLWGEHEVVAFDADLLFQKPGESSRQRDYRDNLAQKLAARRVAVLVVLRDCDFGNRSLAALVRRHGDAGNSRVVCAPSTHKLVSWLQTLSAQDLECTLEEDAQSGLARLRIRDVKERGFVDVVDEPSGNLGELLELVSVHEGDRHDLVSRWFSKDVARRPDATVADLLSDCARRQEQEAFQRIADCWRTTVARMQSDTRAHTRLELVVVATRALEAPDARQFEPFEQLARTWLMSDRLRVGGDKRTLVRARHVWPDSVGALLARLALARRDDGGKGLYAWRSFCCGIGADAKEVERMRAQQTQSILDRADEAPEDLQIERKGPFEPITEDWLVARESPERVEWDRGGAESVVSTELAESRWSAEHRAAGNSLGKQRMKLGRALSGSDSRDPERVFSQQYWQRIQRSPGQLRVYGTARLFRADFTIQQKIEEHRGEWRKEVLERRRLLAREREVALHHAEELDRARKFHVPIAWRMLVGSAVAVYSGFLSLNVLRVMLTFEAGTWATGIWIFGAALLGGWLGAFLPAWVERRRGVRAAQALSQSIADVDRGHREAVKDTHEVFRDAEDVRQTIRITSVHRRTTLLAERAWAIVRDAREEVARNFERRKLLGEQASQGSSSQERLAAEDLRDWRSAALLRPDLEAQLSSRDEAKWRKVFDELSQEFRVLWSDGLRQEDPLCTGFLRVAVLRRLVHRLAALVSERIEAQLLEDAQAESERDGSSAKASAWIDRILAGVGLEAASHSMLTVLDDGAAQRTRGYYKFYRRRGIGLATQISAELPRRHQDFVGCEQVDVDSLPLGGFLMLFHEVSLRRDGIAFVLDESETKDLPQGAGPS
jgi:hypothetical protein